MPNFRQKYLTESYYKAYRVLNFKVFFEEKEGHFNNHANAEIMFDLFSLDYTAGFDLNILDGYVFKIIDFLNKAYNDLNVFFSDDLSEMKYIKQISSKISKEFEESNLLENQRGIVHLDIWYDNLSVNKENEITIFDFDNCGNGFLILDVGYFCKQLFFIESDKNEYEMKVESFLNGYRKERSLSEEELKLIPESGASVFIFYLGVQAQRFDWSNIFLTENFLKMYIGRIKNWMEYYKAKEITAANN